MGFCSYLMCVYARRIQRKIYYLKWSYCGKTERYFMTLLYLFFYPPFLLLFHSALLLHFCPVVSFISWLFKAWIISLLWAYDPRVVWAIACFVCVYFGSVCPWKRVVSHHCGGGLLCRVLQNGFSAPSETLRWSTMRQGALFWAESKSVADLLFLALVILIPGTNSCWVGALGGGNGFLDCLFVCLLVLVLLQPVSAPKEFFQLLLFFSSPPIGTCIRLHCGPCMCWKQAQVGFG